MTKARPRASESAEPVAVLPGWIVAGSAQGLEDAAFRSGAALAHLHLIARQVSVPQALWRDRLALMAAETCVTISGRREGVAALRDSVHLLRPGDQPGPAGTIFHQWSRAVRRPVSVAHLAATVDGVAAERIALCLDAAGATAVDRAARVIESVLADMPRAETGALVLADAVLTKALGLDHLLPLLSLSIKSRDLRLRGEELRLACHRAVLLGVGQAVPLASDLARRVERLHRVVPQLRAKAATQAVDLFLSRDALPPTALLPLMSDRAARRLCDRLVELGAVRELTGRVSFRLYGV